MINKIPVTAELMISLPSLIFSGLPAPRIMVMPPHIDSKKAIPPPIKIAYFRIQTTKFAGSVGIQPSPVFTSLALLQLLVLVEDTHLVPLQLIPGGQRVPEPQDCARIFDEKVNKKKKNNKKWHQVFITSSLTRIGKTRKNSVDQRTRKIRKSDKIKL